MNKKYLFITTLISSAYGTDKDKIKKEEEEVQEEREKLEVLKNQESALLNEQQRIQQGNPNAKKETKDIEKKEHKLQKAEQVEEKKLEKDLKKLEHDVEKEHHQSPTNPQIKQEESAIEKEKEKIGTVEEKIDETHGKEITATPKTAKQIEKEIKEDKQNESILKDDIKILEINNQHTDHAELRAYEKAKKAIAKLEYEETKNIAFHIAKWLKQNPNIFKKKELTPDELNFLIQLSKRSALDDIPLYLWLKPYLEGIFYILGIITFPILLLKQISRDIVSKPKEVHHSKNNKIDDDDDDDY